MTSMDRYEVDILRVAHLVPQFAGCVDCLESLLRTTDSVGAHVRSGVVKAGAGVKEPSEGRDAPFGRKYLQM